MPARYRLRLAAVVSLACALWAVALSTGSALVADAGWDSLVPAQSAQLPEEAERRAQAMAHVATGYLLDCSDSGAAFHHYRRALDLDMSNVALAQEVARLHLQRDEIPEALSVLKDSLKEQPDSAVLALRISGIYVVSLRKFEPAERYAREAQQAAPDLIEPYQMLYSIYRADGRSEAAARVLRQAGRRTNEDAVFWAGLGDLCLRQQLMEPVDRSQDARAAALDHYRRAAELGRQEPAVLLRALNFFFAGGHFADAVASGQRLLVLRPSDTLSREKLALSLASLGQNDEAVAELEKVVVDNPASLLAYRAHGEILLKDDDARGALDKFEKALLLHDDDPRLYLEVADLCLKVDQPDRAVWWLGRAREKFTNLPELPFFEGQLLGHLKRWQEALNAMDIAAALAANYQPSFLNADFYFHHGVVAERSGQTEVAEKHFLSCLELDDHHAPALNYLGYMWAERGANLTDAEEFIRRALQRDPENAAYLDSLGWVLYQQGRYHEALPPLEQAARLSAKNPDPVIEEHLGDVLDKLGRRQEAVQAWKRAAALEGATAEVSAKLQAVRGAVPSADEAKAVAP